MIILHAKINAFQLNHSFCKFYIARKNCGLSNKQKNIWVLGNARFISPCSTPARYTIHDSEGGSKEVQGSLFQY